MSGIRQSRLNIESGLYKRSRINVALDRAEKDQVYVSFKSDVQEGIFSAIKTVATEQNITNLLLFVKARSTNPAMVTEISTLIADASIAGYIDLKFFLVWAGTQGGQAAIDKLGLDGVFGLKNEEVIKYFDDHARLIIKSVDDYTKEWIAQTIQSGYKEGLTPKEIAEMLVDEGRGISKVRAERIAITELAGAMARVESEAVRRYGIEKHIWRTSRDEGVCPICLPLDGVVGLVEGTIDGFLIPAHPSCRCFYEDVIPESWASPENIWLGA
ncbi:minor capsid protein [Candidatus Woesebacteria bacterium]|nr:minor capsid protein [Candidatus Woesebacteria bacterium]